MEDTKNLAIIYILIIFIHWSEKKRRKYEKKRKENLTNLSKEKHNSSRYN